MLNSVSGLYLRLHSICVADVCPEFLVLISNSKENLVVQLHGFSLQEERLRKVK